MKNNETSNHLSTSLIFLFLTLAVLYLGFHGRYIPEYIDNTWSFSWAWNLYKLGEYRDLVFGERYNGTQIFQRTPAIVYGAVASVLGWSREVAMAVSKFFVLASAFTWYLILQRLGYKRVTALTFAGIMLLLEAYFGIANKIRSEPLVLFFCSVSFLLFQYERYLFSGLILGLAVESHPFAIIGGFWIIAYLCLIWPQIKLRPKVYGQYAVKYFFGLIISLGYWYWLHGDAIENMGFAAKKLGGNVFMEYFLLRRFAWRHLPELVGVLTALAIFIFRRKYSTHPFVLPFLTVVTIFPFIMTRGNMHYIVYIYPAVLLLVVTVCENMKVLYLLIYSVLLFQVPQYVLLFHNNRNFNHREIISRLRQEVPTDAEFIYGNPFAWFAFQEREFHAYGYFGRAGLPLTEWPDRLVVIETSDFNRWHGRSDFDKAAGLYSQEDIAEWIYWDGKPIKVYWMIRRE